MKTRKKRLFSVSINRSRPKTPKGRMQYAPTARYLTGFAFVLPKIWVKPAGFHSDLWQSPKPAGFYAMSCGRVQNPTGFTLCRVAESKTRRVLRYVVWRNPKPGGFYAMSCGGIQNPAGFTPCRVAESKTRRVLRYVVWRSPKPGGFWGLAMIFFSSLDGRKEAKEDQGLTEAGELGRKRLPESSPNKFGHSVFRPLAETSKKRIGYAPTRTRAICFWIPDNCRTQILASYRKARFGFIPSDILKRVPVGQTNRQ